MKKHFKSDDYDEKYFVLTERATAFSDIGKMMSIQRYKLFYPFVKEKKAAAKKVGMLEIGCANGFHLSLYRDMGIELDGVDISEFGINEARKTVDANFSVVDLDEEKLPFEDNSFDLIAAFTVLEHLHKPEETVQEIQRIAKDGAYIYLICPVIPLLFFHQSGNYFVFNTAQKFLSLFGKSLLSDHTHISMFHKLDWFNMFTKHNFTIVKNFTAEGFIAPIFDCVSDKARKAFLTLFPNTALSLNIILRKEKNKKLIIPKLEVITHYKKLNYKIN